MGRVVAVVERARAEGRRAQRSLFNICGALRAFRATGRGGTDLRLWRTAVAAAAGACDLVEMTHLSRAAVVYDLHVRRTRMTRVSHPKVRESSPWFYAFAAVYLTLSTAVQSLAVEVLRR